MTRLPPIRLSGFFMRSAFRNRLPLISLSFTSDGTVFAIALRSTGATVRKQRRLRGGHASSKVFPPHTPEATTVEYWNVEYWIAAADIGAHAGDSPLGARCRLGDKKRDEQSDRSIDGH